MTSLRGAAARYRKEILATAGLGALYCAFMNGHLVSVDGLVMWRQALSIVYDHSLKFVPPIWWGGYIFTSTRGLAASVGYLPGVAVLSWLHPYVPSAGAAYDYGLLYRDRMYTLAGAPVWVVVTAATAMVAGLTTRLLATNRRAALWTIAFYGAGSPALLGARGDFPQPLVGLSWAVGVWCCLQFRRRGSPGWVWLCAAAVAFGVLTRPLEGSLLLPGVLLLLLPGFRGRVWSLVVPAGAWAIAVLVTLAVNDARFGSPTNFGYGAVSWTIPIWVGFPYAFVSPGRGALWQFPAMVLAVPGALAFWRVGKRLESAVLAVLPVVLFVESCTYFAWIDGWDWGFRLFQPALPLVAVLAGMGVYALGARLRTWLPGVLLAGGILWNIPAVTTDLLGGYAATYDNLASWSRLDAYPPIGAWQFLHHVRSLTADDSAAIDVVWFRAARSSHWLSLIPFVGLLAAAAALWARALRFEAAEA